jgi:hypothetical protein
VGALYALTLVARVREKGVLEREVSSRTGIKPRRNASTREVEHNLSEGISKRAAIKEGNLLGINLPDTREVNLRGVINKEVTPPNRRPRDTNTSRVTSHISQDTNPAIAMREKGKPDTARSGVTTATEAMEDTARKVDTEAVKTKLLRMRATDQILARSNPLMEDIDKTRARSNRLMEVIEGTTKLSRHTRGETTADMSNPRMADTDKSRSVERDPDPVPSHREPRSVDKKSVTLERSSSLGLTRVGTVNRRPTSLPPKKLREKQSGRQKPKART